MHHITLIATIAALAVTVPSTFAAQGGKPGPGGSDGGTATVVVSPNPAPADGARVDITGCGYELVPAEIRIVHSAG
jgi:hypothetical protein